MCTLLTIPNLYQPRTRISGTFIMSRAVAAQPFPFHESDGIQGYRQARLSRPAVQACPDAELECDSLGCPDSEISSSNVGGSDYSEMWDMVPMVPMGTGSGVLGSQGTIAEEELRGTLQFLQEWHSSIREVSQHQPERTHQLHQLLQDFILEWSLMPSRTFGGGGYERSEQATLKEMEPAKQDQLQDRWDATIQYQIQFQLQEILQRFIEAGNSPHVWELKHLLQLLDLQGRFNCILRICSHYYMK